ncbi:MAG: PEP-CTERM sorting domain-containing protein [Microcystis sp. LE19-10.1B]|uniref:PEP-CTERM sorting domain-containing protein n=1 Tax=Microcystis sp. LE19-10.1B TaxID=3016428 RepID=UPI0022C91422|nr:PEP-CTERM sorting domain-containing protein [Microcystis sp. LE19-10.1B]MCZ8026081.1 PEP-CTERM sorting domain-containing protein [Microcystis sp. LE19-10.1B]MCZ8365754.1 PEP-CTERM sorting domain-containing protein [Microcystis sp. LE19-251.1A]
MKNSTCALVATSKTASIIIGVLAFGCFLSSSANAATPILGSPGDFLTGIDREVFSFYSGTVNNLDLDIGSGIINTGELSISLDPDLESFFEFNYDTGTVTAEYNLLATAIGFSDPLTITLQESGNILSATKIGNETSGDRIWNDTFNGIFRQDGLPNQNFQGIGTGTTNSSYVYPATIAISSFATGSFSVSSKKKPKPPKPSGGGDIYNCNFCTVNNNKKKLQDLLLNTPSKNVAFVSFNESNGLPCVPEPSSILGIITLGTLGAASTLKRKLKPSKSTEKETTKVG